MNNFPLTVTALKKMEL